MSGRRGLAIRTALAADAAAIGDLLNAASHPVPSGQLAERLGVMTAGQGTVLAAWEWGPPRGGVARRWFGTRHGAGRMAAMIAPPTRA